MDNNGLALPSAALAPSGLSPEAGSQAEQPATNAGHTPGPWRWLGNWLVSVSPVANAILTYTSNDDGLHGAVADKALIAAAPDLLSELQALVTAVKFADPPKNFNGVECHEARVPLAFVTGAEAAIAKATGAA